MRFLFRYRAVIYAGTLITGFTGLVYQVVWQKYLGFLLGSDARAVSLVVAVFLAGLAAGYRYWGGLTVRVTERRRLLRIYGTIELGIGLYAAAFLVYFRLIRWISYGLPPSLASDALVAILALLPPTFLMGATIPLLVKVVPDHADEVHLCHAKIYGVNTLGACLGAFGAGFLLLPGLGLANTLLLASALNAVVGLTFIFNPLRKSVIEHEEVPEIPNRFTVRDVYLYTLVTGTITLSFEVLFIRVLHMTIGAGPLNFALIVGVFVLGLALGSLTIRERMLSVRTLFGAGGFLVGYLVLLYYTIPYWPYWLNDVRALLRDIPINYDVYMVAVTLFMMVMLLPFLVPLGFMLPLVYALIPKTTQDYGRKCGWIYFYNTLGTALGAVLLSHVALKWIDLDQVFKLNVCLLVGLLLLLLYRERHLRTAILLLVLSGVLLASPRWDRRLHYNGLYMQTGVSSYNFQGLLQMPEFEREDVRFFRDGPDTTIAVLKYEDCGKRFDDGSGVPLPSSALFNNARSEGDTAWDHSTMTLSGLLPYLFAPERDDLQVGVVGLGTGVTAGLLGVAQDVAQVTVSEISPTVVQAGRLFDPANYGVMDNPKVRVEPIDGFKYFAHLRNSLDIVVSVPSVVWSVGVENLFTPYYYRLVDQALVEDGLFMQWFPTFDVNQSQFRTILHNLLSVFPHLRLYAISEGEFAILASRSSIPETPSDERFTEPAFREALNKLAFVQLDQLSLVELHDTHALRFLVATGAAKEHALDHPTLAYGSDRHRFLHVAPDVMSFLDTRLLRVTRGDGPWAEPFRRLNRDLPNGINCVEAYGGTELFCKRFNRLQRLYWVLLDQQGRATEAERIAAYDELRLAGVVEPMPSFLGGLIDTSLEAPPGREGLAVTDSVMRAYVMDGAFDEAQRNLERLWQGGKIPEPYYRNLLAEISRARQGHAEFLARYLATPGFEQAD